MSISMRSESIIVGAADICAAEFERIKATPDVGKATEMGLWRTIKDWFRGGVEHKALVEVHAFFHGTDKQKEKAFDFLRQNCETEHREKFVEKVAIDSGTRVFTIHTDDGVGYSQAVALTQLEKAEYLVKNYGDFFAAPFDDQKGFVDFFKDKVAIKDYLDGLEEAMREAVGDGYEEMSDFVYGHSAFEKWEKKQFQDVLKDNPEVMSYVIDNRNHPAIKEWRKLHLSPAALDLPPAAQEKFSQAVLEPVPGGLHSSGISVQAAFDWHRATVTIDGHEYANDENSAAQALHKLTADPKLTELVSRYATQGSLQLVTQALYDGDVSLFLPDGRSIRDLPSGNSRYFFSKSDDGVALDFVYTVNNAEYVCVLNHDGFQRIATNPTSSFGNFHFALNIGADYKVSIAKPLRYDGEFTFAKK